MHSALFVATIPDNGSQNWHDFLSNVERFRKNEENVKQLSTNVWLANFHKSPNSLCALVAYADRHKINYGILQFADEPRWLPAGFDPKTSQGS
jgi:hypothetical protein